MKATKHTLRPANNSDAVPIMDLVGLILPKFGHYVDVRTSEADLLDIEEYYFRNDGCFYVMEDEGIIIATIGFARQDGETCILRKMYVHPAFRGRGLAKELVERVIADSNRLQYRRIRLETIDTMIAAIRLYEKYGFQRVAGHTKSPRCNVIMEKELTSAICSNLCAN